MIHSNNPIPLHIQLRKMIEKKINQGIYTSKIPSERELMEEYSVSRSTVREAISQLVIDGIVEKRHGKGTYITRKPVHYWLGNLISTTKSIENMGMKPGTKLIKHGIITVSDEVKEAINLAEAYLIKRVRYADDMPIAIETQYYPIEIGEKLSKLDIKSGTLYDLLEDEMNIQLHDADEVITSKPISKEDCKLLNIKENSNSLHLNRFVYDINGDLIEYCIADYNPGMYAFHFKSQRLKKQ
ncbi:GntR family transcriptional regulator [Lysinibacillus sp. NPDC093210]|uniref:GntR family transcriptional regulator n=1 Tax=Lysinibacillus sp. NPDC093210 TaxID=3364133 RepID=UPI003821125C